MILTSSIDCVNEQQALNQHPSSKLSEKESSTEEGKGNGERELSFKVGVSVDKNKKCRRTMEELVLLSFHRASLIDWRWY